MIACIELFQNKLMDTSQRQPSLAPVLTYRFKAEVNVVVVYWDDGKRQSCPSFTTLE